MSINLTVLVVLVYYVNNIVFATSTLDQKIRVCYT